MLTQQDLEAIGNLIDKKLDEKLDKKFKEELAPIKMELKSLREDVNQLKKDTVYLRKELTEMRKDMKLIVRFFDNDITGVRRRVDRLEDYLHLSS